MVFGSLNNLLRTLDNFKVIFSHCIGGDFKVEKFVNFCFSFFATAFSFLAFILIKKWCLIWWFLMQILQTCFPNSVERTVEVVFLHTQKLFQCTGWLKWNLWLTLLKFCIETLSKTIDPSRQIFSRHINFVWCLLVASNLSWVFVYFCIDQFYQIMSFWELVTFNEFSLYSRCRIFSFEKEKYQEYVFQFDWK